MRRLLPLVVAMATAFLVGGCTTGDGGEKFTTANTSTSAAAASPTSSGAAPPSARYVNLGDSYAAGTGVTPLVEGSNPFCQRSSRNYAQLLAERLQTPLTDVACAGARTADLTTDQYFGVAPQLDALGPDTELVTLMLGGNDEDTFGGAIRVCGAAAPTDPTGSPCRDQHGDELSAPIAETIEPDLEQGLREIRSAAPHARVVIIGYPWIVPATQGCYPTVRIATGDVPYVRALQADLNAAVRRAAEATGADFVDMSTVSDGHDACAGDDRWVEPQQGSTARITLHPNARGQQAIADQVERTLGR
ncbi:SGNH/GDSL hydrolase family protein [Gordonia desulfuricans]|uniref:SGNH/GDSL hydrolase family protein n=1 Tax=Gordonia desulfuricans TaxID=89051 RepID=A0A7K3LNT6_9ACTN|nr:MULTISPECIES: SGNH/GDSL hydrolase family protein [Gordonia]NDK89858.1 SGNH/GDSL hydrolase family protein [Gordonia desulfuricans]WLP92213.1 SGNH/GDSL hydrolase family protein [Gordonia sp. NB41Y]